MCISRQSGMVQRLNASSKTTGDTILFGMQPTQENEGQTLFPSIAIEDGATVTGKVLGLSGEGVQSVPDLFTQTVKYHNFNISDTVRVLTNGHAVFNENLTSASTNFFLDLDNVTVQPGVELTIPGICGFTSDGNMDFGAGSKVAAGVLLDLYSSNFICCSFFRCMLSVRL